MQPRIGAARTPYARTVRPVTITPSYRPDPGTIFDSILVRKGFTPHPTKISSVLFYLASIIIHGMATISQSLGSAETEKKTDLFRTDHHDPNISNTSSYLDLSPLYGSNEEEQTAMRTFENGKIKPDCFSEARILGFPLGVGVLLITFNRFVITPISIKSRDQLIFFEAFTTTSLSSLRTSTKRGDLPNPSKGLLMKS